jgi:hypothetical protein
MQSLHPLQTTDQDAASSPQVDACPQYQVIYLHDDADHSVNVVDTATLPVQELLQFLLSGGSVFISCKSTEH